MSHVCVCRRFLYVQILTDLNTAASVLGLGPRPLHIKGKGEDDDDDDEEGSLKVEITEAEKKGATTTMEIFISLMKMFVSFPSKERLVLIACDRIEKITFGTMDETGIEGHCLHLTDDHVVF